jgi:AraC-like DNA-binding protein
MKPFSQMLSRLWFELEHYETVKLPARQVLEWYTPANTLLYFAEGEGLLQDVLRTHELCAGDFYFYPQDERIRLHNTGNTSFILRKITFACVQIDYSSNKWKFKGYSIPFWGSLYPASPTITQHLIEKLCTKLDHRRSPMENVRDRALFYRVWEFLAKATQKGGANEEIGLHHVAEMLREQVQEKFSIEELAYKAGLNVSEFFKRFKQEYGTSPGQYHIEQRLRRSLEMLTGSTLKVADIAHNVGYDDEYYFSRVFRQKMGLSPADYIGRARKKMFVLSPFLKDLVRSIGIKPCILQSEDEQAEVSGILEEIADQKPDCIIIPSEYRPYIPELQEVAPVYVIEGDNRESSLKQMLQYLNLEALQYEWLLAYHVSERKQNRRVTS